LYVIEFKNKEQLTFYPILEFLGHPIHKSSWLLSFQINIKSISPNKRTKIFQITSSDSESDLVTVYARTKTNQKIDVHVFTSSSEKVEIFKKDMDNNTRFRFEQTKKLNNFSDLTIFVNDVLQVHLSDHSIEESFRMLTTSQENDYTINPINFDDSKFNIFLTL